MKHQILLLLVSATLLGCTADIDERYNVDIRWTSYGIPHVRADDWGSLGYGFAYATATDGICVFAREVVRANGTQSADFGESDENLASDSFYRAVITPERVMKNAAAMSKNMRAYGAGFVAGYNRFINDQRQNIPAACAGEKWVRPISELELGRMFIAFGLHYGTGNFTAGIAAAAPPGEPVAAVQLDYDVTPDIGSNAIALGSDLTQSGKGILFGNPHYPWQGPARFHMIHTTIPGELDTMGASLLSGSFVVIGFNKDIAWTHTVSTAMRFNLYELELHPDDPMQYRYGDEYRSIEPVTVQVPGAEGDAATLDHTVYLTHYGPVIASEGLAWSDDKAYTIRDAIADNTTSIETYFAMQKAASVAEIEAAISKQGTFFVNTIAADRDGNAFYGDLSATPNLDAETIGQCRTKVQGLPGSIVVLNGSDPTCEWKMDSRSAVPGNLPPDDMPRATSTEFFTNSNDSYWLSNPDRPLEGYPRVVGDERTPRNLRTRAGLTFMGEELGNGAKLKAQDLQEILFSHRHFGAEVFLDDVLTLCDEPGDNITGICNVNCNLNTRGQISDSLNSGIK